MAAGSCIIYALCDPLTGECRYIGKTKNLAARLRGHRWEAHSSKLHTRKVNWLRNLGQEPLMRVLEEVTLDRWAEAERQWIAEMRRSNAALTNFADGGQTSPVEGKGHSSESKERMRAAAIRNGARPPSRVGIKASAETRKKLSDAMRKRGARPPAMGGWNKGLKMSPEFVEANRAAHVGKPWTPARRAAQIRRILSAVGGDSNSCR